AMLSRALRCAPWRSSPRRLLSAKAAAARRTPLFDLHTEFGGRMVEFAGHQLPVQYAAGGIVAEHKHARESAGLFDVSHMQQLRVCGVNRDSLVSFLTVADVAALAPGQACLSLFLNGQGRIMDDLIVSRCREPHFYLVTNAGCAEKIRAHLDHWAGVFQARALDVRLEYMDAALMALQGPRAAEVLAKGVTDFKLADLAFMHGRYATVFGVQDCRITRCGYTGMDGFEISVPPQGAMTVARALLDGPLVKPIGLGARDSLRLEAGLCLYGNDIDETRTPVEAGLMWTVSKRRRQEAQQRGSEAFLGGEQLAVASATKPEVRRVGLLGLEGPPARHGAAVFAENDGDEPIGVVTSGCMSPSLNQPVAMGYLRRANSAVGTPVRFEIRGKRYRGVVAKMPFLPATYYTGGLR
ncbi:hypothetical protein BOX15_Mlig025069g4, partial [Macrostomum lignano]